MPPWPPNVSWAHRAGRCTEELQQDHGCRCTIGCGQAALPTYKGNTSQGTQDRRTAEMRRVAASWNTCSIMMLTKGKSSLPNVIAFHNGMTCCVDEEGAVHAIYLDFSKAFGTALSNTSSQVSTGSISRYCCMPIFWRKCTGHSHHNTEGQGKGCGTIRPSVEDAVRINDFNKFCRAFLLVFSSTESCSPIQEDKHLLVRVWCPLKRPPEFSNILVT